MSTLTLTSPSRLRVIVLALALAMVAVGAFMVSRALAASTNCSVNASGGYINCLTASNTTRQTVKAWHSTGLGYQMRLYRSSDGTSWGPWSYSDLDYHTVPVNATGVVTEQVDNQGSANPASYYCEMT